MYQFLLSLVSRKLTLHLYSVNLLLDIGGFAFTVLMSLMMFIFITQIGSGSAI